MRTFILRNLRRLAGSAALLALLLLAPLAANAADYQITHSGTTTTHAWADMSTINLADGDVMTILPGATTPTAATVINIAANANVTINGNAGTTYNNLCIQESGMDTGTHNVTVNNLQITAPTGYLTYNQNRGNLVLSGGNVFGAGDSYVFRAPVSPYTATITSSSSSTLTMVSSLSSYPPFDAATVNINGNAGVMINYTGSISGMYVTGALNIAAGAGLIVNATYPAAEGINCGAGATITNNGTLTVNAGADAFNTRFSAINIGAGSVTTIYNGMTVANSYTMIPASGYQWSLTNATIASPGTVTSGTVNISVPAGKTGTITLAPASAGLSVNVPADVTLNGVTAHVTITGATNANGSFAPGELITAHVTGTGAASAMGRFVIRMTSATVGTITGSPDGNPFNNMVGKGYSLTNCNFTFTMPSSSVTDLTMGFTFFGATVSSVSASPATLPAAGGTSTISVVGNNQVNPTITAFDGATATTISGVAAGGVVTSSGALTFPANTSTTADKVYTIKVSLDNGATWETQTCTVTVSKASSAPPSVPSISVGSLPGGTVNELYYATLSASGDTPIAWSITSGSLPPGLSFDPASGEISGTPTASGTFNFTVTATNAAGSASKALSIAIVPPLTYSISASTPISFGTLQIRYALPTAQAVTVTNTGTGAVTLTQPSAVNYEIGAISPTNLAPGAKATFTIQPKAGLAVGNYDETIAIGGSAGAAATVNVSFTIIKATPTLSLVATPADSPSPAGNITLTAQLSDAAPIGGQTVTFTVNGVAYTKKTNPSGEATFVVANPAPGSYNFGASYAGDANNEAATATNITGYTVIVITGMDNIAQSTGLKAWVENGTLHVGGLTAGKPWSVYNVAGILIYRGIATCDEATQLLTSRGVYIVQSETGTVKVVN